ncbi:cyclic-phosphate processing receiver domain-containing protein [Rhizobium sp. BK176]|uniref:cyclic-phosphate processing receiver domain-containing protein n=1 Tax=Rhizobium sp. BK176 TaxID=2587071 RepID=UPI0021685302|nr:cyclic-phosphate processing receiver domain-containing protein [Rhizobium sp. BK176]MCS4089880.1 hypothetical protein [Rhizobium sp. BK176]
MSWKLFIDDDCDGARNPAISVEDGGWRRRMNLPSSVPETAYLGDWVLARSADEAIAIVEELGMPSFISFDHDLGDGKDAIAVAHWLIERDMDGAPFPADFAFEVHSGNPIGRANIRGLIDNYLEFKARNAAPGNGP